MRIRICLVLALLSPLQMSCGAPGQNPESEGVRESQASTKPVKSVSPGMKAILQREFARTDHETLLEYLREGEPRERERAAYALGQYVAMGLPDGVLLNVVDALGEVDDEDVRVERAAKFSLNRVPWGQVVSAESKGTRADGESEASPGSSRLTSERAAIMLRAMGHGEWVEPWRRVYSWQRRNRDRLRHVEEHPGEVEYELFLKGSWSSAEVFVPFARDSDARARIFAIRGLATQEPDETVSIELRRALSDSDWRVVCEACVGLAKAVNEPNLAALVNAASNKNPHVRRVALESLGAFGELREKISRTLDSTHADPSSSVQTAAIVTAAKLYGDHSAPQLALMRLKQDPVLRAGVAEATRYLSSEIAVPMIEELAQDPSLRVAGFALESLAWHKTPESRALLHEHLQGKDNGLRLMALLALKEMLVEEDLPHLERLFEQTAGDNIADEVRFNTVRAACQFITDETKRMLREAREAGHGFTRRVALEEAERLNLEFTDRYPIEPTPVVLPDLPEELVALSVRSETLFVRVETTRGSMLFELFPRETPFHVYNFLELARRDHYDGLDFHRVVPDFVIQGGDTRGDGNGGATWRGGSLPAEFTARKYVRGSLGMPRNEDPDSGGSQIFVTHRATPHLDGRYTIFGELREGFEVLDRIEVGDRILDVVLVDN